MMLLTLNLFSQSLTRSVISVTGACTSDNNGILSYSAGEAITGSLISNFNGLGLTQGFQQPSLLNKNINDPKIGINAVEVYPNPVVKDLSILFNIRSSKLLHIAFFSSVGNLYRTEDFNVSESGLIVVNMTSFPSGFYLLHVYSTDKLIDRVFKIEKL